MNDCFVWFLFEISMNLWRSFCLLSTFFYCSKTFWKRKMIVFLWKRKRIVSVIRNIGKMSLDQMVSLIQLHHPLAHEPIFALVPTGEILLKSSNDTVSFHFVIWILFDRFLEDIVFHLMTFVDAFEIWNVLIHAA